MNCVVCEDPMDAGIMVNAMSRDIDAHQLDPVCSMGCLHRYIEDAKANGVALVVLEMDLDTISDDKQKNDPYKGQNKAEKLEKK